MYYWNGKKPDAGIFLNHDDDYYFQDYSQNKKTFRALAKDDILQTYTSVYDSRTSNITADDVGYIFYRFSIYDISKILHLRNQKK